MPWTAACCGYYLALPACVRNLPLNAMTARNANVHAWHAACLQHLPFTIMISKRISGKYTPGHYFGTCTALLIMVFKCNSSKDVPGRCILRNTLHCSSALGCITYIKSAIFTNLWHESVQLPVWMPCLCACMCVHGSWFLSVQESEYVYTSSRLKCSGTANCLSSHV